MPFLIRPGQKAMPQPRSLGALLREMWDDEVANRRRAFALARSGEPPADSKMTEAQVAAWKACLLYTSPSPRDQRGSRMPSSA